MAPTVVADAQAAKIDNNNDSGVVTIWPSGILTITDTVRVGRVALIYHRTYANGNVVNVCVSMPLLDDVKPCLLSGEIRHVLASSPSTSSDEFPGARAADALTFLQHTSITRAGNTRRAESGRRASWSRR